MPSRSSVVWKSVRVTTDDAPAVIHQESVGGRFEPDGSFRGTRWHSVALEPGGDEDPEWESTRSEPSPDEVAGLRILVAEMIRRQPPRA
jgi:hypothetical protein